MGAAHKPTVLVYRTDLLPRSETFIKEQMLAYRKWRGILIGRHLRSELPLDGLDVRLLRPVASDFLSRAWWSVSRRLGDVPYPVLAKLRREEPSLLHAHFGVDGVHAWPIARALGLPMLVTLHGYDINIHREWWEAGHWGAWFRDYPRRLLELSKQPRVHFVAVSEAIRRKAIDFGIPAEKVSVRYIGVDARRFAPSGLPIDQRERRVLFVGRLVEKKGCEFLIRAMAEVQKVVEDATLVVAGDGELRRPLEELARELGIQTQFLGALAPVEIQRELALAKVFCLPSVTTETGDAEGLPIVLLEAQASGLPSVASAHSGSVEAICNGRTGFSFIERDVQSLAGRLLAILTNETLGKSMSSEARLHIVRTFDIHTCTLMLERLYDDMRGGGQQTISASSRVAGHADASTARHSLASREESAI